MLNDIKIVFYEDDKFKHQTGELKLVTSGRGRGETRYFCQPFENMNKFN